jgi:hypothetical protein
VHSMCGMGWVGGKGPFHSSHGRCGSFPFFSPASPHSLLSPITFPHTTPHHTTPRNHSIATNAVIPIAFSFLGDLYPPDNRSLPSTLVTAAMGVGASVHWAGWAYSTRVWVLSHAITAWACARQLNRLNPNLDLNAPTYPPSHPPTRHPRGPNPGGGRGAAHGMAGAFRDDRPAGRGVGNADLPLRHRAGPGTVGERRGGALAVFCLFCVVLAWFVVFGGMVWYVGSLKPAEDPAPHRLLHSSPRRRRRHHHHHHHRTTRPTNTHNTQNRNCSTAGAAGGNKTRRSSKRRRRRQQGCWAPVAWTCRRFWRCCRSGRTLC